jgi:Putative bacterial sensory transduction regulator
MLDDKPPEQERQMATMLRSHVERCLQDVWEQHELIIDGDGDYPYRWGTAACWVAVQSGPSMAVRVFAHAAHGLKRTAKLLTEINEVNARSRWARVFWDHGRVIVAAELPWTAIDRPALDQFMRSVGTVADDIGAMLAAVYGGQTPLPPELDPQTQSNGEDAA